MSENWGNIDELIVRQLTGAIDADDNQQLLLWLSQSEDNKNYYEQMQKVWNSSENIMAFGAVDVAGDYDLFAARVGFKKEQELRVNAVFAMRKLAAVLLPLIAIGIALMLYQTTPGYGRWVAFGSGDDVKSIVLPDNSVVDLNTHSRLIYEKNLDGDQRELKLEGEGFFKVAKNLQQPFVVKIGDASVKVLGTAFYLEEKGVDGETNLIVTEGKVEFSFGNEKVIVERGESAELLNGRITKKSDICYNNMAWRTGLIEFDKAELDEVLRIVSDHFSDYIDQIDNQSKSTDRKITTKFNSPSLEEVLVELRIHFDKNFTMHGKKLIISD